MHKEPNKEKSHIYEHMGIKIEVGTIHSVKDETHTATLYLETFYDKSYNGKRIMKILMNPKKKARHIETLKRLHVAFSRPTHLLCCL